MKLSNNIKLLVVTPSIEGGGAEKNIVRLINDLRKRISNLSLKVYVLKKKRLFNNKNKIKNIKYLNNKKTISSFFFLLKAIKKIKPNYILVNSQIPFLIIIFLKKLLNINSKIIIRETNMPFESLKFRLSFFNILNEYIRKLYILSDFIITPSQTIDNFYNKLLKYKNTIFIQNPIQKKNYTKNVNNKNKYILFIGNYKFQKNLIFTIKIFYYLKILNNNLDLYIIGRNNKNKTILKLVNSLNLEKKIFFFENVFNVSKYIQNSEAVISTSRWEGMPNSVLEAIALNKKIISTKYSSGLSELVKYGAKIKIYNTNSPKLFANNFQKLLKSNIKIDNSKCIAKINYLYHTGLGKLINIILKCY